MKFQFTHDDIESRWEKLRPYIENLRTNTCAVQKSYNSKRKMTHFCIITFVLGFVLSVPGHFLSISPLFFVGITFVLVGTVLMVAVRGAAAYTGTFNHGADILARTLESFENMPFSEAKSSFDIILTEPATEELLSFPKIKRGLLLLREDISSLKKADILLSEKILDYTYEEKRLKIKYTDADGYVHELEFPCIHRLNTDIEMPSLYYSDGKFTLVEKYQSVKE